MRNPPNDTPVDETGPTRLREGQDRGAIGAGPSDDAGPTPNPSRKREGSDAPERTCILTRTHGSRDALLRLALDPDGQVFPDIRAKAPGRGAWIGVGKAELEQAIAKGKLKGALARAFKGAPLSVPDDLPARIEEGLRKAALDRLGLEARASNLVTGAERIETAARAGQVRLLLHAADASAEGRRKLDQAWRVGTDQEGTGAQGLVFPEGRAILSLALGRQNVVHVAVTDKAAAARVLHALDRWRAFIGCDAGLEAAAQGAGDASAVDVK